MRIFINILYVIMIQKCYATLICKLFATYVIQNIILCIQCNETSYLVNFMMRAEIVAYNFIGHRKYF